jgi:hypothetical protein
VTAVRAKAATLVAAAILVAGCGGAEPRADAGPREDAPSSGAPPPAGEVVAAAAEMPAPVAIERPVETGAPPAIAPEPLAMAPPEGAEELHPAELLSRVTLPTMKTGQAAGESVLEEQFRANPALRPEDPEADAVRRGRRLVPALDGNLANSFDTPEALAEAILAAIEQQSVDAFEQVRVDHREFERFFWPEFPQSRPITNVTAADAWLFHNGHCRDGVLEMIDQLGGQRLHLQSLRYREGVARYRNFNLYHGVVIEAATDAGDLVEIEAAPIFAERNGRWKAYIFDS